MTKRKYLLWFIALLVLNLSIRLIIFRYTELFGFSDFRHHLGAIEKIAEGEAVPLISGNYLFAISYIGYFFKYIAGNLDYFFCVNSLLGTAASGIISILVLRLTLNQTASLLTLFFLSLYTEFLVFSSLFYTVILMVFLLSVLLLLLFEYYNSQGIRSGLVWLFFISSTVFISFLFKQELLFLPMFMFFAIVIFRKDTDFVRKTTGIAMATLLAVVLFYTPGLTHEPKELANDFIFFGHTNYGGDGGEGSLIYPENKARYTQAWKEYLDKNNIIAPTITDRNRFQSSEIKKFIRHHPGRWVKLQFTKFFRTFGVVPEGTSFKILYSGLLKEKLWLTSFVIVAPVAIIIILFILLFDIKAIRKLYFTDYQTPNTEHRKLITDYRLPNTEHRTPNTDYRIPITDYRSPITDHRLPITDYRTPITEHRTLITDYRLPNTSFLKIYLTIFIYYITATIFFGHYQERYRIPVMVVFIIPVLSYFIASLYAQSSGRRAQSTALDKPIEHSFKRLPKVRSIKIKAIMILIFLIIWVFQAKKAINNQDRLNHAIEMLENQK